MERHGDNPASDELVDRALSLVFGRGLPPAGDGPGVPGGDWIDGRYRISGELGRGGMGIVYRARDEELGRDVALKILKPEALGGHLSLQRFTEEARICARLQHPGIAPVYDAGFDDGGRPWFTMGVVEGVTLKDALRERDAGGGVDRFLAVFEDIAQAVAAAHGQGVIHRDLKPANVMLGPFGQTFVLDWGLSKVLRAATREEGGPAADAAPGAGRQDSLSGSVVGTMGYMPPEQARGEIETLDRRADVFALGSILLEILTGRHAYAEAADIRAASRAGDLDATRERAAAIADGELAGLTLACLAADRKDRPEDAGAVARAATAWRMGREARRLAAEQAAATARATARHERRLRRRTVAAVVAVAAAAIAILGAIHWQRTERERHTREAGRAIFEQLAEARSLLDASASLGDEAALAQIQRAADLTERANRLSLITPPGAALVSRIEDLGRRIDSEAARRTAAVEALRRNRVLEERLDGLGQFLADSRSPSERAEAIRSALHDYGIDVASPAAASLIRKSPLKERIIHALHDWLRAPIFGAKEALRVRTAAVRALAEAIDDDPWRQRFRAACFDRDLQALSELARADGMASLPPSSVLLIADALIEHGMLDQAEDVLRTGRRRHEGDFHLNQRLAWTCLENGRNEDAVAFGRAAESIRPATGGGYTLAIALVRTGRKDEAAALADRMTSASDDIHARMTRVLLAQERGDREAMAKLARAMCDEGKGVPREQIAGGRILGSIGLRKEAGAAFERAAEDTEDIHYLLLAGEGMVASGLADRGIDLLERAAAAAPDSPSVSAGLARALFKASRWHRCLEANAKALELRPGDFRLRMERGLALARLARMEESCTVLAGLLQAARTPEERKEVDEALRAARSAQEVLDRVARVVAGAEIPATRDEWSQLIGYVKHFRIFGTEARLWERLRTAAPDIYASLPVEARAGAIAAFLSASAGIGVESASSGERQAFREAARVLLAAEVEALEATGLAEVLDQCEPFRRLREGVADPPLDDAERSAWQSLLRRL